MGVSAKRPRNNMHSSSFCTRTAKAPSPLRQFNTYPPSSKQLQRPAPLQLPRSSFYRVTFNAADKNHAKRKRQNRAVLALLLENPDRDGMTPTRRHSRKPRAISSQCVSMSSEAAVLR